MSFRAVLLILFKYLKENWLRIILASGGIIIGVWSITLTSFLSLGLSEKIITAINSQSATKYIQVQKDQSGANSFFDISGAPNFVRISPGNVKNDTKNIDSIVEVSANSTFSTYLRTDSGEQAKECLDEFITNSQTDDQIDPTLQAPGINLQVTPEDFEGCYVINQNYGSFENFYESNRTDWIGQTTEPTGNEVVACYQCNPSSPLYEELSLQSPQELLGQTLTVEYIKTPVLKNPGTVLDVTNPGVTEYGFEESQAFEVKVAAVIDDRNSSGGFLGSNNFYTSAGIQQNASLATPDSVEFNQAGFIAIDIFIDNFQSLDDTVKDLQDKNYLVTSTAQLFITAVQSLFLVITIVLGLFGLIALVASIFGITNVMAISVLKRQKEIGILKALGARNWDILKIFFLESTMLGIIGWLIGTFLGYVSTLSIAYAFERFVLTNDNWARNLENFGITDFYLPINLYVILATLVTALIITSISGIFPAIRASRQDPVQTLKN